MSPRTFAILLRFDYWLASLIGAPEIHTLSGYAYKVEQAGKPWGKVTRPVIDWLARVIAGESDHCRKAFRYETR